MPTEQPSEPPFDSSRRLTGPSLYFAAPGAVLQAHGALEAATEQAWRLRVAQARAALGWPAGALAVRRHAHGADLALAAPADQLLTATHVNEWAWLGALGRAWVPSPDDDDGELEAPVPVPAPDIAGALALLFARSAAEREPALQALLDEAARRGLPVLLDDTTLSLGLGRRAWHAPRAALPDPLPAPPWVPWADIAAVPVAVVTGTNGKTTSVRVLTAIARAADLCAGHNSTEGIVVDGALVEGGDCAGPDGARRLLREVVDLAVVEAARGGILRRGLALARADVALVTNVGEDHLGDYGIDTVADMAGVKLVVARAVDGSAGEPGTLVLNADDALLRTHGPAAAGRARLAWFALDDQHPLLVSHRAKGGATAGVRADGHLWLADPTAGVQADLGAAAALPLTAGGHAAYNTANLLGAALAAHALGLPLAAIRDTLAHFGRDRADNAGRLAHWTLPGPVQVFVDFAHNPDGLVGLLTVARAAAGPAAPLRLVLGQAGNRTDAEICALATCVLPFNPACVIVKELPEYARGRPEGAVTGLLRQALLAQGLAPERLSWAAGEAEAAQQALDAARPGDVIVLPLHTKAARERLSAWLDAAAAAA